MDVNKSNSRCNTKTRNSKNSNIQKDAEIQNRFRDDELEYPSWWTCERFFKWLRTLPEDTLWNCFICLIALMAIVWVVMEWNDLYVELLDLIYNIAYTVHVFAVAYSICVTLGSTDIGIWSIVGIAIDIISYLYHALPADTHNGFKLLGYYLRLHRPLKYLWALNDYNLNGSVLGTTLKYCYIFFVLRVSWALVWVNIIKLKAEINEASYRRVLYEVRQNQSCGDEDLTPTGQFLNAFYIVNKMFIPIGPSIALVNDMERIVCLLVMITGCMVVTGMAVASLSLGISIYMRPEETFRARYRLIMKEMKESNVPPSLREKVETFYKMYWHKQKAVSATRLLPTYPPALSTTIYTDIYFEVTQKSRVLCDLSYSLLSELAKKMQTIHYIPGDPIIKRSSRKSTIIYIAYGDIEMLSAEDDSTAMLRMTRGTVLSGYAAGVPAACARAHVDIRAATFCTTHALHVHDIWRIALKYGRDTKQAQVIQSSFDMHFERVKGHYFEKIPEEVKYKSSILYFKRNLMALKEAKDSEGNLLLRRSDVFLQVAGSYIMRNRADASQTDEADAICLRPTFPYILQPSSSLQVAWHSFISCVIVTVCFTHPYYLVFKMTVPVEFRFFDCAVTVLYIVDIIAYLSTGANVEDGVPITFAQTSSQQMRSRWFALDVLSTLPIFEFIGDGHFAGINKLLRLPQVFRVLKSLEDTCVYHSNLLRFLSYTLLLIIACYLIAALQQSFMCFHFRYCVVNNFTHPPYWANKTLDEETERHRLTFSLYWAISMITFTTHMETWAIDCWNGMLYTMFVLEVCIVLHIFIEAVYSATIMVTTGLREDYNFCIANVKEFLVKNQVDPLLRQRFITYLQLCWYTDKAYSMTNKKISIFYDLPPHVYQDIVTRQRSKYLLCLPFMKLLNKEDLKTVSSRAKLFHTSPNEILLNTGEISNEMYVIKQGICEILDPETKTVVRSLGVKNQFGVLECLLRIPAYYTVRAATHVQIFSISLKVLVNAIEMPQIKDAIEFAKEQPEYTRLVCRRNSFLYYEPLPPVPNKERFRLPRKYEMDYDFLHPFNRLGLFSILRYIFPRFTIRPDGEYLAQYEWLRAVCALLSAIVFPCYTYIVLQWPSLYYLTLLLDGSAYFDIFQRMLVGYFNAQGVLVYHPISTATHYIKGAFFIDFFACLPLENLESPNIESFFDTYRLTSSRQYLMLNRLLQLYRLPSVMIKLESYIERRDILLVLSAIPLFMAFLNALTCLVVYNSVNIFWSADDATWRINPLQDEGGSWIHLFHNVFRFNMTETPWNLHLAAFFWVVYETTTTGYSSFKPSNFDLMEVLFVGMVIGAMITTYFSVRIISIRANVNKELAAYLEHTKDIAVFMRRESLDKNLQNEVLSYYEYNWEKMGGVDYNNVLKLCDQITLRTDAILHIYGPTFEKCPFLANSDISLLRMIGRAVRSAYFLRGMTLVYVDDVIENLYFVDYGVIFVEVTNDTSTANIKLTRGSVFGNLENVPTIRCPVKFVASTKVHILQIKATTFHNIISDFPHVAKEMEENRVQNENYIMADKEDAIFIKNLPNIAALRDELRGHKHCLNDKFVQLFFLVVSFCSICADVYNASFQNNNTYFILVLYALDLGFCLKILIYCCLPHFVLSGYMKALVSIRKVYFSREFKYDLMSCLPVELLCLVAHNTWMAFSWLRLNRIFRIVTLYKCFKCNRERTTVNLRLSVIFSLLIWFTLLIHVLTCMWYFIGYLEDISSPKSSWMYNDKGHSWCDNLYICSMYFILTTFTQNGVGDIMPKQHVEVIFVSILQIISTLVCMVYVGEFSNIIQFQSFRSFSFYCKYLELQEFLKNNRVSKNLVTMVNRYTLHLWREVRGHQLPYFLRTAPPCLKLRVMSGAYMQHLVKNPVFMQCELAFLRQLVGCLQLYTYNEDMYVVKENEITDSMYMIHSGRVLEINSLLHKRRVFTSSESFGMEQGLMYDKPYPFSYRTLVKSQVLTLRLTDWEYLLKHFPKSKESIYKYTNGDYPPQKPRSPNMFEESDKTINSADNSKDTDDMSNARVPTHTNFSTGYHIVSSTQYVPSLHETASLPSATIEPPQNITSISLLDPDLTSSFDSRLRETPQEIAESAEAAATIEISESRRVSKTLIDKIKSLLLFSEKLNESIELSDSTILTEISRTAAITPTTETSLGFSTLHANIPSINEPNSTTSRKESPTSGTATTPTKTESSASNFPLQLWSADAQGASTSKNINIKVTPIQRDKDMKEEKNTFNHGEIEQMTSNETVAATEEMHVKKDIITNENNVFNEKNNINVLIPYNNDDHALVPYIRTESGIDQISVSESSTTIRSKHSGHYKEGELTLVSPDSDIYERSLVVSDNDSNSEKDASHIEYDENQPIEEATSSRLIDSKIHSKKSD